MSDFGAIGLIGSVGSILYFYYLSKSKSKSVKMCKKNSNIFTALNFNFFYLILNCYSITI